jgi:hypothetical protein
MKNKNQIRCGFGRGPSVFSIIVFGAIVVYLSLAVLAVLVFALLHAFWGGGI